MSDLDPRLNAFRSDLADARLKGRIEAAHFIEGNPARIAVPVANIRRKPGSSAGLDTQMLMGETLRVFDMRDGWAWVQSDRDGYVGYVNVGSLGEIGPEPTHIVSAPRTFLYPGADLRFPYVDALSMGSAVIVTGEAETRGTRYLMLDSGKALIASHLKPVADPAQDYVALAETLLNTPYLWGGKSGFGIDCSGLVQLSMRLCGKDAQRDTYMQEQTLGQPIGAEDLRHGDLVFWKGHVAIMTDAETMIHANGHTMLVSHERLDDAIARIGYLYGQPTSYRRP